MWFVEHHFTHDGYLPSPLVAAAALASRTKRMRLSAAVALMPLYHPVRLAEEIYLEPRYTGAASAIPCA